MRPSNETRPSKTLDGEKVALEILADLASAPDAEAASAARRAIAWFGTFLGAVRIVLFQIDDTGAAHLSLEWIAPWAGRDVAAKVHPASVLRSLAATGDRLCVLEPEFCQAEGVDCFGYKAGEGRDALLLVLAVPPTEPQIGQLDPAVLRSLTAAIVSVLNRQNRHVASGRSKLASDVAQGRSTSPRYQLTDAIDSLDDGFALFDTEDQLVVCNQRYREIYAKAAPLLVPGTRFGDIARLAASQGQFADREGKLEDWIASRRDKNKIDGTRFERNLSDGRVLRVVERLTPHGERVEIHSDITELKLIEQRLRNVIEGARIGTWEWDVKEGGHEVNDYWAESLGYRHEELEPVDYSTWRSRVHPDDLAMAEDAFAQTLTGETEDYRAEYRLRHKDGHWIWMLDFGRTLRRGWGGVADLVAGVQIDISEQKAREEALIAAKASLERAMAERASAEQRFIDIASVADGWLWELDKDLRFSFVSRGDLFDEGDVPMRDVIGKTIEEWLEAKPTLRIGVDWDGVIAAVRAHLPFRGFVYHSPGVSGDETHWRRISGTPVFDGSGAFVGYRGAGADVTQLYVAKARAEEASRTKSMFLANMSHEIRTPLNGVLGMAEVLESDLVDENHRRMIGTIRRSGEALLEILNDILDMSKIEAGKLTLEVVAFSVVELAGRVEDLHGLRAEEKGLNFEVLIGSGADAPRLGDPYRIQQILHNLISNAIKFTDKGEVAVKISGRPGKPIVITVRDTGIGMTPEQVARIHEEFAQADNSVTRRFGGTGLGMAITRSLVERMGGTIGIQSAIGEGTSIEVSLPLPMAELTAEKVQEPVRGPVSLAGLNILAADDNRTNREVIEIFLVRSGASVTIVGDGAQAVEAWAPGRFDAVLLDIAMPEMDGPTALRQIREREAEAGCAEVPVIAVTANAMAHQVAEYLSIGFDSCLAKPIDSTELTAAIRLLTTAR